MICKIKKSHQLNPTIDRFDSVNVFWNHNGSGVARKTSKILRLISALPPWLWRWLLPSLFPGGRVQRMEEKGTEHPHKKQTHTINNRTGLLSIALLPPPTTTTTHFGPHISTVKKELYRLIAMYQKVFKLYSWGRCRLCVSRYVCNIHHTRALAITMLITTN